MPRVWHWKKEKPTEVCSCSRHQCRPLSRYRNFSATALVFELMTSTMQQSFIACIAWETIVQHFARFITLFVWLIVSLIDRPFGVIPLTTRSSLPDYTSSIETNKNNTHSLLWLPGSLKGISSAVGVLLFAPPTVFPFHSSASFLGSHMRVATMINIPSRYQIANFTAFRCCRWFRKSALYYAFASLYARHTHTASRCRSGRT
jgi:hypothetical protein